MSKCTTLQPPFLPHLLCSSSSGLARGGLWGKGAVSLAGWGEGELLPSRVFLAGPRRTAVLPLYKPGKPSVPGYFARMNLSSPPHHLSSFSLSLGQQKASTPRLVPCVLTKSSQGGEQQRFRPTCVPSPRGQGKRTQADSYDQ